VKVFLAGATGAIGRQLVPLLLADGHEVTGTTRSPERAQELERAGARSAVLDALDAQALQAAVVDAAPDAVIHELTSLPQQIDPRRIERDFVLNDRLRSEGTRNLVQAAQANGVGRILAQSIAFSYVPGPQGTVHRESDPLLLGQDTFKSFARSADALRELERITIDAGGLALRYGYFYGPGTAISSKGSTGQAVLKGRLPIVAGGSGVWSFVHIRDAAQATVAALTNGSAGAYNIVDDEPAAVRDWVPALAQALGARNPRKVPAWMALPLAGRYGIHIMRDAQGASNEKAKRELGWSPEHTSWREGFSSALG
jgi:nucleoside-diphosphate-sugar epimerase